MLEIGFSIYYYRLEKGMTQTELARKAGVPQPNLSNIEKGKKDITLTTLKRLSLALEVPAAILIDEGAGADKSGKIQFGREMLEKLAKRIAVSDGTMLGGKADEIVRLFSLLLPARSRQKPSSAEVQRAWIQLRKRLSADEIRAIYQRVQDARQRQV